MFETPLFKKQREESEQRKKMESKLDLAKLLKGEIDNEN